MKRLLASTVILLMTTGCAVTRPRPAIDPATLDHDSFLSWLADQPLVSTAEAYRAMLIADTDQDPGSDFARNQQEVFRRDIARSEWKLLPDQAIDRATAAFMVAQVAKVRGGINLNLFGRALHVSDRRYAYRELVYEGLPQAENAASMVLTGGEFISFLTWADQWKEKGSQAPLPAASAAWRTDAAAGQPRIPSTSPATKEP
jgi:hypothetical protein